MTRLCLQLIWSTMHATGLSALTLLGPRARLRLVRAFSALTVMLAVFMSASISLAGDDSYDDTRQARRARPGDVVVYPCPRPANGDALQAQMLEAVNARRRAAGLAPLRPNTALTQAAAWVACDNSRRGRMDHDTPPEGGLRARIRATGYRFSEAFEALAFGYAVPERLATAWYGSAYHYPTLMTASVREAGIAVVQAADGKLWWAMISARPR